MAGSNIYPQHPLLTETSTRLVELSPGAFKDDLQCQIQVVDLAHDLEGHSQYEAISYVWGSPTKTSVIKVFYPHGKVELPITKNLAAGLRRFRRRALARRLWVDSISINQDTVSERNHQVRLMAQIYRKASRVLIWLGEDHDAARMDRARTCMDRICAVTGPQWDELSVAHHEIYPAYTSKVYDRLRLARPDVVDVHRDLDIPLLGSPELEAMRELLGNPWFFRAWTWQESYLARQRRFYRGQWMWSDHAMAKVCDVLWRLNVLFEIPQYSPTGDALYFFNVQRRLPGSGIRESLGKRHRLPTLPGLLWFRRGSSSTLPVDILYSLLGAATDCPDIHIDYAQPFEIAFARSTWQIMVHSGKLSVLSMVERDRLASDLPTWVPDWRVGTGPMQISDSVVSGLEYAATGSSKSVGQLSHDAKVISLSGLHWDSIAAVRSAVKRKSNPWVEETLAATGNSTNLYNATKETLPLALLRVFYLDRTSFAKRVARWKPSSWHDLEKKYDDAQSGSQEDKLEYARSMAALKRNKQFRNIFVTNQGRLGMASDKVREGDIIAMLLGGEVPTVLRPSETAGHYTFVAECYVHGFMDGEALVEARKSAQPDYDSTDVSWLERLHEEEIPFPIEEFHIH